MLRNEAPCRRRPVLGRGASRPSRSSSTTARPGTATTRLALPPWPGCGQGTDEPKPVDDVRAKLRGQALDWLKAERDAWAKVLDAGDAQASSVVRQTLQHWQDDSDLAGVRDRDAIEKLPADERRAWEALWKDVETLLKRVARSGVRTGP